MSSAAFDNPNSPDETAPKARGRFSRVLAALLVLCVVGSWCLWVLAVLFHDPIESMVGDKICSGLNFRTLHGAKFLANRLFDGAWLITLLAVGIFILWQVLARLPASWPKLLRLTCSVVVLFIAANVWGWCAMQTASFWLGLQMLDPGYRLPSVSLERQLLGESKAKLKGILLASSQGPAQIEIGKLNSTFYPAAQFANLSYAGAQNHDFLLLHNYLRTESDIVICYVSEMNFYRGVYSNHILPLMTHTSYRELDELGVLEEIEEDDRRFGNISRFVPLFRARRAIQAATFGGKDRAPVTREPEPEPEQAQAQETGDQETGDEQEELSSDEAWARRLLKSFRFDETAELQKAAMRRLVEKLTAQGCHVYIIGGNLHPYISDQLEPALRKDMLAFLTQLDQASEHVEVLIEGEELPRPEAHQYLDWLHLANDHRPWYTERVMAHLRKRIANE